MGLVAPRDAESAGEVSLARGGVGWASLQKAGGRGQVDCGRKRSEEGRLTLKA